jgi:hypothetical protein|tara:strand:- start:140 stop:478 length:339 start_codon:yes stop_codon:yes gene_type:complete
MRIDEFTNATMTPRFDYDIVDDVTVFMRNDPMFYRKSLFPAVSKMADLHRAGKPVDKHKCLSDVVEEALGAYCKKYNIADQADGPFNDSDRDQIIDKIFGEEMEQIKKGDYK